jgi:MFS family permease
METRRPAQWRVIVALNSVSVLAQIGQFGIAFILFPLALEARDAAAFHIGAVSSALWVGNLAGLIAAPTLIARLGYRCTVSFGLMASSAALTIAPFVDTSWWALFAALAGVGYGLRWIGNETWLFGIVPNESRGRIVGFHESLCALAAVIGPGLIAVTGAQHWIAFAAAAAFTLSAGLPLWFAGQSSMPSNAGSRSIEPTWVRIRSALGGFLAGGALIAGIGGLIEGGTVSLFPVFASDRELDTSEAAWMLSVFGLGAMLLQFPLGWLVDTKGFRTAIACTGMATALSATVLLVAPVHEITLGGLMFVLGGAITAYLTLGIIAATRDSDPDVLAKEVSRVSIAFTGLSAIGPLIAGGLVTGFGSGSLMIFVAVGGIVTLALASGSDG